MWLQFFQPTVYFLHIRTAWQQNLQGYCKKAAVAAKAATNSSSLCKRRPERPFSLKLLPLPLPFPLLPPPPTLTLPLSFCVLSRFLALACYTYSWKQKQHKCIFFCRNCCHALEKGVLLFGCLVLAQRTAWKFQFHRLDLLTLLYIEKWVVWKKNFWGN